MRRILTAIVGVFLSAMAPTGLAADQPADEAFRGLASQLKRGVDGVGQGDDQTIVALRQLRDPRLRPLFAHLATAGEGDQRAQSIIGLAELDEPPKLDLFLVGQIKDPVEQARVLTMANDLGLLGKDQVSMLLSRPDLAPQVESRVAVMASALGEPVDAARAARLAASDQRGIAVTGVILLAQSGAEADAKEALGKLIADSSAAGRRALSGALQDIRAAKADKLVGFAAQALAATADEPAMRCEAVATLLELSPKDGVAAWLATYDASADLTQRLRLGFIALAGADKADRSMFAKLAAETGMPLLRAIGVAGGQAAAKALTAEALEELIRTDHPPCVAWALNRAIGLDSGASARVRLAALSRLEGRTKTPWALMEESVRASASLAEEAPAEFARAYTEACWGNQERVAQALLLGAMRARDTKAMGAIVSQEPPGAEAKALAAIVLARGEDTLTPEQGEALSLVASGKGGLSEARRSQAAWLALRHMGQERNALAVVLAPGE